jgi:hypothetical protein
MPRIRCHYIDCAFLDDGLCSAGMVELDPDTGCKTYSASTETTEDDNWEEENELEEWEELDEEDEEDESWEEDSDSSEDGYN